MSRHYPNRRAPRLNIEALESRVQPAAIRPLEIALISDSVAQAGQVQSAAMRGVVAVAYDNAAASFDSLVGALEGISASHGGAPIGHLGLVAHGSPGAIDLGATGPLDMQDVAANSPAWDRLRNLLTPNARIDLYACDVAAGANGKAFVNALAARTGADIYASTDAVGNGKGADWTWEYHTGVRGAAPLFNPAALKKITGLVLDDVFEENDSIAVTASRPEGQANSPNFGPIASSKTIRAVMDDNNDYYRFTTVGPGTHLNYVSIEFAAGDPNLDLWLYDAAGNSLGGSADGDTDDRVTLLGLPAGTYYIQVYPKTVNQFGTAYDLRIEAPLASGDDPYESNNNIAQVAAKPEGATNSPNLGPIAGSKTMSGLVQNDSSQQDWFRFTTLGPATHEHFVSIAFNEDDGNLDLWLYDAAGNSLGGSADGDSDDRVTLLGLPAGTYFAQVYGKNGARPAMAAYDFHINAPLASGDDAYESNNSIAEVAARPESVPGSPNLGVVAGSLSLLGLVQNDSYQQDWFRFTTTAPGNSQHFVSIAFNSDDGNLDLWLYDAAGNSLGGSADGDSDDEISLNGRPAGTYYVQVYGKNGARPAMASYDLQIRAPGSGLSFVGNASVTEGDGGLVNAEFTVTRSDSTGTASVDFETTDGSALAGADYVALPRSTLVFNNGETSKKITVQVRGDTLDEPDESFFVNLSNPIGVVLNTSQAIGTILDDDNAGALQFSAPTYSVSESVKTAYVKVTRTGGADGQVTVQYTTDDGSAVAPDDYTTTSGTLTFNNGEVSKTISIPIVNDALSEPDESINLILTNPTGGAELGSQSTAELIILANDKQPGLLQFSTASYSVSEGIGHATITVNRVGGDDGAVTVKYATANKTAVAPGDYTSETGVLNFADGETSQSFDIEIINDGVFEGDEFLNLTLSAATGGARLGAPRTATLTITNDDVLMTPNTIVAGAGNSGLIKVLDGPTGTVKLTIPAFPTGFTAGVRVATGDVNGDGAVDIIASPGANGGTTIRVFDGKTGAKLSGTAGEFPHGLPTAGGIFVAAGDVNGDGKADIIAGAGAGSSEVRVFSGLDRSILSDFQAFPGSAFGVRVAVGDVTGDGAREIIIGSGEGGSGDVAVFTGAGTFLHSSHPFDGFTGEINITVGGDVNGDGKSDIIVGRGIAGADGDALPHVKVIDGTDGRELVAPILVYASNFKGGVRVAAGDVDGDGIMDLIVAGGPGSNQKVKVIDLATGLPLKQLSPFGAIKTNGVFVAGVQ